MCCPKHRAVRFTTFWCVSALLCSTCSPCGAEELRDYSAGFEKLRQLGLPDVSTGTYVNLEAYIPDSNSLDIDDLELGGNSWLLREDKAAASEFVHGHVRRIQVYDPKILRKIVEKELEELPAKERRSAAARNSYGVIVRADWGHLDSGAGCGFDLPVPGRNYPSPGVRRSPRVSHRLGIQASNPIMFPALLAFPTNSGSRWGQTTRVCVESGYFR